MIWKKFCLAAICLMFAASAFAQEAAPELAGAKSWLNTAKPLTLSELKGKVVLLDFWTYGCINCIHIIPDLKKLEAKYPNGLVVIGVHSGKFANERDTENIRKIIVRYDLEHPIANDADFKIWDAYSVQAWPTQVLIDAEGKIAAKTTGEGQLNLLDKRIGETIAEAKANGKLNESPLKFALEKDKTAATALLFPGKIAADAKTNKLFIADSNHNRIVVTDLSGKLQTVIGNGAAGLKDGDFQTATFSRPQGMAFDGKFLYVADTGNHAIRRVDFAKKTVETIAGTGEQGSFGSDGGDAKTTKLNSPWDVLLINQKLYVAMAGDHQIWRLDLAKNQIAPFAGTGAEARADGDLGESAFAQPSGLATDGKDLFVADAESNIIRRVDLTKKTVTTLAGGDLFDFGDKDGAGDEARLQHPLGVVVVGRRVFIADTYNHKIKTLNPTTGAVKTFLGSNDKKEFYEPGGLSAAGNKIYVADTNHNQIRVIDAATRKVSTLTISNLK